MCRGNEILARIERTAHMEPTWAERIGWPDEEIDGRRVAFMRGQAGRELPERQDMPLVRTAGASTDPRGRRA